MAWLNGSLKQTVICSPVWVPFIHWRFDFTSLKATLMDRLLALKVLSNQDLLFDCYVSLFFWVAFKLAEFDYAPAQVLFLYLQLLVFGKIPATLLLVLAGIIYLCWVITFAWFYYLALSLSFALDHLHHLHLFRSCIGTFSALVFPSLLLVLVITS